MSYRIIWLHKIIIFKIIVDYLGENHHEVIDCRTKDGQERYIDIFGLKRFNLNKKLYGVSKDLLMINQDLAISKNLVSTLFSYLDERSKRLVAGFLSLSLVDRKKCKLANFLSIDIKTIKKGASELLNMVKLPKRRLRRSGGGRKSLEEKYENFKDLIDQITEDYVAGDPMIPRRWVRKNLQYFKEQFSKLGVSISRMSVRKYFRKQKITLKGLRKHLPNQNHKDRDSQFQQINRIKKGFLKSGRPVISIDCKKKEEIGLLHKHGKTWRKTAKKVFDHDFKNLIETKILPFGIFDLQKNSGHFYCTKGPETSQFIVEMIVKWWDDIGKKNYVNHNHLLILCDAGGGNGYDRRGWKVELQERLASQFGLKITVCHYPPGQSKYNPIEHRLFSFVSKNMEGETIDSVDKFLSLIRGTRTKTGLKVEATFIEKEYKTGLKYSDLDMYRLNIAHWHILPDWTYTIYP